MIILKYAVNLPYPEIKVESPNLDYATILSNIYAGQHSELTTILLYIFEHISFFKTNEDYSKTLRGIAIVEMHHLQMLGELISLLGMKPIYMSFDQNKKEIIPWNSSFVNYNTNIKEMIDIDIQTEQNTIQHYKYILTLIKDKYITEIIERIIKDEELHLSIFQELKKVYS